MRLTELMQAVTTTPQSIRTLLRLFDETRTTELLATLFEAATLKQISIQGHESRNPLESMVTLYAVEEPPVDVDFGDAPWTRPAPADGEPDGLSRLSREALEDTVRNLQRSVQAEQDAHENVQKALADVKAECVSVRGELSVIADALRAEKPNVADSLDSLMWRIPHE